MAMSGYDMPVFPFPDPHMEPGDTVEITMPGVKGAKSYRVYQSHRVPEYRELRGWPRRFARLRRRPMAWLTGWHDEYTLVAEVPAAGRERGRDGRGVRPRQVHPSHSRLDGRPGDGADPHGLR